MKYFAIISLLFSLLISISVVNSNAAGLQEFIQNQQQENNANITNPMQTVAKTAVADSTNQMTHIIEMVVAGVVGSALIISLLVLFLGRWVARKDRVAMQSLRQAAELEKEHITSAAATIREQEKETTSIIHSIRNQAAEIASSKEKINHQVMLIDNSVEKTEKQTSELEQVANNVSQRMSQIQSHWDDQLRDTVSAIQKVQSSLNENLSRVDDGLDKMNRQKSMSEELMQDFLKRHNEQNTILENNSKISDQVSVSLEETLKESTHLLQLLKKQQKEAEQALKNFNDELSGYEEQAYEQFDSSFQVADIARQELSANIEESRKHLESMRRYEEQSHGINVQTQKHLEMLDYTKIVKLSHTLNSTQDMFTDLRDSVEEAQNMLNELKDIETDVKQTAHHVKKEAEKIDDVTASENNQITDENELLLDIEKKYSAVDGQLKNLNPKPMPEFKAKHVDIDFKIASGDNAPLSFFKHLKPKEK